MNGIQSNLNIYCSEYTLEQDRRGKFENIFISVLEGILPGSVVDSGVLILMLDNNRTYRRR